MDGAPLATLIFDEAHSEAWTIRPEIAAAMQPSHPADASYARAAAALAERDFAARANSDAPLDADTLEGCDVLVIAHPSDPRWERTTGIGTPLLGVDEVAAIDRFVADGGGLIVLGETEQDKYGNNLNVLLERFGLRLESETVQDYEHSTGAPTWILADLEPGTRGMEGDVLARVHSVCLYRATTISADNGAHVVARTHGTASTPGAPIIATSTYGCGRVVVLADSDLFGDDCIDEFDHRALWLNLAYWAAGRRRVDPTRAQGVTHGGAARVTARRAPSQPEQDPAWLTLREETNALARLQAPDGRVNDDISSAAAHVARMSAAIESLAPHFDHQRYHLEATVADLRKWIADGFGKPDFTRALDAFHPERGRRDGQLHLVLFPMYKQNGSRDTCFEALLIRTPWPAWIAELERTRYDNPKFVSVQLISGTRGYDSECAVLFPETVSVAQRPVNNFGAIFCDREAERLRRIGGAAAELLGLNVPPDAARLLTSPELSEQAYILWDLIHDRTHSHGELPFDPFMIRQRAPYWMYSLEELRCDLTTFAEAVRLEREGVGFGRHVQYAILLDRLLRFPITGTRIRNYDGLGGQLLFSHLHRHDHLIWADNQLTIDWERIGEGVEALHDEIGELYRSGIDRTKLQHWAAAHDLVAASVPAATGSRWALDARRFTEAEDLRPYLNLVLEDEFPLSIFYSALKAKLSGPAGTKLAA